MKISTVIFVLAFVFGQNAPAPEKEVTVTAIPGVISAGTRVERVWTGLNAGEGDGDGEGDGLGHGSEPIRFQL